MVTRVEAVSFPQKLTLKISRVNFFLSTESYMVNGFPETKQTESEQCIVCSITL